MNLKGNPVVVPRGRPARKSNSGWLVFDDGRIQDAGGLRQPPTERELALIRDDIAAERELCEEVLADLAKAERYLGVSP